MNATNSEGATVRKEKRGSTHLGSPGLFPQQRVTPELCRSEGTRVGAAAVVSNEGLRSYGVNTKIKNGLKPPHFLHGFHFRYF